LRLIWLRIGLVNGRNVPQYIEWAIGIDRLCRAATAAPTCGQTSIGTSSRAALWVFADIRLSDTKPNFTGL
jgi:hypothetical protein